MCRCHLASTWYHLFCSFSTSPNGLGLCGLPAHNTQAMISGHKSTKIVNGGGMIIWPANMT